MEDNEKNMETTAESVENKAENNEQVKEQEKTFTRDELNKIVNAETTKALDKYKAQVEAERTEAEKLAKMDKEEKARYREEQLEKKIAEYEARENARTLKDEAINIASQKEIPIAYLDLFSFENMTAEKVKIAIETIETLRNKDRESYLNNALKQKTPTQKQTTSVDDEDPYLKGFDM